MRKKVGSSHIPTTLEGPLPSGTGKEYRKACPVQVSASTTGIGPDGSENACGVLVLTIAEWEIVNMSIVRGALVLTVGFAAAACAGVYVAANRPLAVARSSGEAPFVQRSRTNPPDECLPSQAMPPTLETLCQEKAECLRRQLGRECQVVVQEPFVIAGDASPAALERKHSLTIEPACRVMARQYFRRPPDRPITLLLFSDETIYRHYAELLFFDRNVSRFGYFKPGRNTILVNLSWGDGPLLHELTHALMHFDFPQAAVWLREGLASLHETSSLVSNGERWVLEGKANWRLEVLKRQIQAKRLQSLQDLIQTVDFDGADEAVHCAQARCFCLFLQQKTVLAEIYRRYRTSHNEDPRGEKTVLLTFPGPDWQALDAEFDRWVTSLLASEGTVAK